MNLISFHQLRERGIRYSRVHLSRLIAAEKFPRPVHIGERYIAWPEAEIDAWIAERVAQREQDAA